MNKPYTKTSDATNGLEPGRIKVTLTYMLKRTQNHGDHGNMLTSNLWITTK